MSMNSEVIGYCEHGDSLELLEACKNIETLYYSDACENGGTAETVEENQQPRSAHERCSICFGGSVNTCYTDVCEHTFCYRCLELWLTINSFCPACNEHFRSDFRRSTTKEGLLQANDVAICSNESSLTGREPLMVSSTLNDTDTVPVTPRHTGTKRLSPTVVLSNSTGDESSVKVPPFTSTSIRKPIERPNKNNVICQYTVFRRGRILDFSSSDEESNIQTTDRMDSKKRKIKPKASDDNTHNKKMKMTVGGNMRRHRLFLNKSDD